MTAEEWLQAPERSSFLEDVKSEIYAIEEALQIAYNAGQASQIKPESLRFLANEALAKKNEELLDRIKKLLKLESTTGPRPVIMTPVTPDPDDWGPHEAYIRKAYRISLTLSANQRNNLRAAVESLESWVKNPDHARDALRDFLKANPKSKLAFFPDDFGAWIRSVRQEAEQI